MRERLNGAKDAPAFGSGAVRPFPRTEGVGDPAAAAAAVSDLLGRADPPTALFCLNNRITVGAVQELIRLDSRVELVGFDDFELSHLMPRPIRVIAYDTREMARQAAELLFERIDGRTKRPGNGGRCPPTYLPAACPRGVSRGFPAGGRRPGVPRPR